MSARCDANTHPLDAASPHPQYKPYIKGSGNKEQIGYVDQVGGQSFSADFFEFGKHGELYEGVTKGGTFEPMNPAFLAMSQKSALMEGSMQKPVAGSPSDITSVKDNGKRTRNEFVQGGQRVPVVDENARQFASGVWSQGGEPGTEESGVYSSVSKEDPYDPPKASRDEKLRYGGRNWKVDNDAGSV